MWYVLFIATANLAMGFALGCYLGRGFRSAATMAMPPDKDIAMEHDDSLYSGPSDEEPLLSPTPRGTHEPQAATTPATPEVKRSPAHQALEALVGSVVEGRQQLQNAQKRFHGSAKGGDAGLVEACLAAIIEDVRQVADAFAAALVTFEPAMPNDETFAAAGKRLAEAIDRYSKVVKEAVITFAAFDPQRLDLSIQEAEAKLDDVLAAADRIRDRLDEVVVALGCAEDSFEALAVDHGDDRTTGLPTRLALAIHLRDWWKKDPQRVRRLTLGAVDVDELGKLNRRFGYAAGDRFVKSLVELVGETAAKRAFVASVAGTRLVLCGMDEDADLIGSLIEKTRQTLDSAEVRYGDEKINVTASCAVTDSLPDDTCETLLVRLDAAVRAAKRAGRNRTFLHDGTKPTPVVPPNVATSPRTINLTAD